MGRREVNTPTTNQLPEDSSEPASQSCSKPPPSLESGILTCGGVCVCVCVCVLCVNGLLTSEVWRGMCE